MIVAEIFEILVTVMGAAQRTSPSLDQEPLRTLANMVEAWNLNCVELTGS
jgi:hypothetical protein